MQNNIDILSSRVPAEPGQALKSNLPARLTSFIGREQEVAQACVLLRRSDVRLLTLTGPGGIGKTRLALEIATDLISSFVDGISFVPLAPISEPDLVIPVIAQTLGLKETEYQPLLESLKAYCQEKNLLLLLDNFEQVVTAAPLLTDLLMSCPELKMLVTSRAVLRIHGEHEFLIPSLALPDLKQLQDSESLSKYASVALFLQRAQAIKPDFHITKTNTHTIAEICARLDGLPLAIELAAARIKLFSPQTLLARLSRRLQVLTGGARDVPTRHQTLRDTIAWSYNLLDTQEQRLFRWFSIFVGGCTLDAVESLCTALGDGDGAMSVMDGVTSLIDRSFLQLIGWEEEESRLVMLETIREYGLEALEASGEMEMIRQAHAAYYLVLAEEADPELEGQQQAVWLERLQREHDNLRAALQWLLGKEEREQALRLGSALWRFWLMHGSVHEGRDFLERSLVGSEGVNIAVRAKALLAAAALALHQDDVDQAAVQCEESLALFSKLRDTAGVAIILSQLGYVARLRGDMETACSLAVQAVSLSRTMSDTASLIVSLGGLAFLLLERGEYIKARALFEESVTLSRKAGNKVALTGSLFQLAQVLFQTGDDSERIRSLLDEGLSIWKETSNKDGLAGWSSLAGQLALSQGDTAAASALIEESLQFERKKGDRHNIADLLSIQGRIALSRGDLAAARALYEEGLAVARNKLVIAPNLEGLAAVIAAQGKHAWAARLWGAAEVLRETIGAPLPPVERSAYELSVTTVRTYLSQQAFAAEWAKGRTMTPEQALAAQGSATIPEQNEIQKMNTEKAPTYPAGLTRREVEVLRLVAQGLNDAQVAAQLVISPRTVNTHLTSVYSKLGVSSRSAATRYILEQKLV